LGGNLKITNSIITSETSWEGIDCSDTLEIKGSALLNASTAVKVNSEGYATITGTQMPEMRASSHLHPGIRAVVLLQV